MNLYTYVHNNPLSNIDPTGHWCSTADGNESHPGGCWNASNQKNQTDDDNKRDGQAIKEKGKITGYYHFVSHDGVHEDKKLEAAVAFGAATCYVSCPALIAAALGASDVAAMGTTLTAGTVIVARSGGVLANAWGGIKSVFSKQTVTLYRGVSDAELVDLNATKLFDGGNNMSGKWMADSLSDAETWLTLPQMAGNTRIISVTVPKDLVTEAYYSSKLDGVGPAHYFESDVLNSGNITVKVVK